MPNDRGAVTLALVSGWDLLELARLQVHDYWLLQLSFLGFFGYCAVETWLLLDDAIAACRSGALSDLKTELGLRRFKDQLRELSRE